MVILQARSIQSLVHVLSNRRALLIALGVTVTVILGFSLVPHVPLLRSIFTTDVAVLDKLELAFSLLIQLGANTAPASKVLLVVNAVLLGVLAALLDHYIAHRRRNTKTGRVAGTVGFLGSVAALFGIGCAACGSVIVVSVLSLVGATGLLALLPLHGLEFGLVGFVLLAASVYYLALHVTDPLVCRA